MTNQPTPETDALQDELLHADTYTCWQETLKKSHELERERDEVARVLQLANNWIHEAKKTLEQAAAERDEARSIASFAMDKDYYEKYQRFCAELEVVKAENEQLRKMVDDHMKRMAEISLIAREALISPKTE